MADENVVPNTEGVPVQNAPATETNAPDPNDKLTAALAMLTEALGTKEGEAAPVTAGATEEFGDLNTFDVESIEDPMIRSMAEVLRVAGAGLDLNRAIGKAIDNSDASLLDVAYIKEKAGAQAPQLITIAKGILDAIEAKTAVLTSKVYEAAGGEEQWQASVAVWNSKAPEELKMVVRQMVDSGKENMVSAGAKIVAEFAKKSGAIPANNGSVRDGAAGAMSSQGLSAAEFKEELMKLDRQDRNYTQQYTELVSRRSLGKKLGK